MIKYFEYDSFDEYGQHITPVNSLYHMNKLALASYSPELMRVILNMKRLPNRYYVVVNALGSYEVWGCNRNGDAFPESGLIHKSLRTDMGTTNDYGYKTFEYYAKLYKHHVNKDPKNSFGDIVFAHWNPVIHRVELIIAINTENAKDIVDAIEAGNQVSVSMGCLTDPEYPILTIDGYKPIKDIVVGETVFTHAGNWRKVTEVHRRKYTGKVFKIGLRGLPLPIELTADHPMMMKCFQKTSLNKQRSYISPEQFESKKFDWAHIEHAEIGDHIKYLPVQYSASEFSSISDERLAKLMGYYFAEGSFIYNNGKPCSIQLACHIDDDLPREVPKLINEVFPGINCSIRPHAKSEKGLSIDIHSTKLACFMDKYMSHLAINKKIPPEIFLSETKIKLSFIGAWISGDGFCDAKGVHISSCNINALLQARDLLITCGIPASIYKITHKAGGGFNYHETVEYTLNMSHIDAEPLIPYCNKKLSNLSEIIESRVKIGNTAIRINADSTYSYTINDIESRDVTDIQTYNFEVEGDESYVAAGLVSHNCKVKYDRCSICGNKAATRAKYCIHLRDYMKQIVTREQADRWSRETGLYILPGTQVFAYNDYPRFFDLSRVHIGADRTSYMLGKAARYGMIVHSADIAEAKGVTDEMIDKVAAFGKKSEIEKDIGGALGPTDIDKPDSDGATVKTDEMDVIHKAMNEKINNTIAAEPRLPNDLIDPMAKSMPLESIFSTLFGLGIHPKPQEFQRIVLIRIGRKDIADELDDNNLVFDHERLPEQLPIDISDKYFNNSLGRALTPFLEDRSCYPSFLGPRMNMVIIKEAGGIDNILFPQQTNTMPFVNPTLIGLGGLAALYAGLKFKALGYGPKQLAASFMTKPWLQAMLGGTVLWKLNEEMARQQSNELPPASACANYLQNTNLSGHVKTSAMNAGQLRRAALGTGIAAGMVTAPAMYVSNVYNQKSLQQRGVPLFRGAGANPIAVAGVSGLGAGVLYHGIKKVLK